ncbi:MAG: CoA transferase [Chitinispirillaceae bacterium]|nr:CoA transferase [Chitinispirillaceae bacterium]
MTTPELTTTGLLNNITILEIGSSDALHVAGMLLADQGAAVIRIELSDYASPTPEYHRITDRSKQLVRCNPATAGDLTALRKLVSGVDILIDDLDDKLAAAYHLEQKLFEEINRCTIVPTLHSDRPDTWNDTTAAAMAGVYEDGFRFGSPPRCNNVEVTATLGALYTINAVAQLLLAGQRFNTVDTIRIPLDRILLFAQSITIMMRSQPPVRWEPFRFLASPFMCTWKAAGGTFLYLHIGMPRHLRSFLFYLAKIGYTSEKERIRKALHPATRRDPMSLHSIREGKEITKVLHRLFLQKTADEWEELLGIAGLCCTKIRSFQEWCRHPQVQMTNQVLESTAPDGNPLSLPGALFVSGRHPDTTIAPPLEAPRGDLSRVTESLRRNERASADKDRHLPLEGIRVLDLGRVIAGPYCGRLFAEAGAEVLQVSLRNNHLNWEEFFGIIYNTGKSSVAIDFKSPEGKDAFRKLFEWFKPDVVIHNFMDDAAKKIGCDYESCKKLKENVVVVDFAAYTRGGPWENFLGMEQNVQATSGIISTFSSGSVPRIMPVPPNDLSAGLISAFGALLSLLDRKKSGQGNRITSYISFPSILMHLHSLSGKVIDEHTRTLNRYFKTTDGYILLSTRRDHLNELAAIPQAAALIRDTSAINESMLERMFKKQSTAWWIAQIRRIDTDGSFHVVARKTLTQLLKKELSVPDALFSYAFHPGYGRVVYSKPPLSSNCQLQSITPAQYPGSDTVTLLEKLGIDPTHHAPEIPKADDKPVSLNTRIWWILKQIKWLSVIAYRNRFLKGF